MTIRRQLMFFALVVLVTSCAQLPKIHPGGTSGPSPSAGPCGKIFPQGKWQLYHTIEATVPGGRKNSLTGVSVISSRDRYIHWALMTVEGFVLFSGRYDGTLTVDRAVGPFNRPGFAQGLMADLMLLFFMPEAPLSSTGFSEAGDLVCRYGSPRDTTDIILKDNHSWRVRRYSSAKRLDRTIEADEIVHIGTSPFANHMILKNHGLIGYQLELKLVEAIPIK